MERGCKDIPPLFRFAGFDYESDYCPEAIEEVADELCDRALIYAEIEFFASVIHGYGPPSVSARGCAEGMGEFGLWDVEGFAVFCEAVAEFGVFAVEEELFVESFDRAEQEACAHDLGDFGWLVGLGDNSGGLPVGAEELGVRKEFFEK